MKNKVFALTLAVAALAGAHEAAAYTTSFYTKQSTLSSGHCVKVEIDTTGIYELSHARLRELGFSDPSAVHVFGYGGVVPTEQKFLTTYPDDLPQAASMHTADGRLLFYAEGTRRLTFETNKKISSSCNYYDKHAYYFLSDSPQSSNITTQPYQPSATYTPLGWSYGLEVVERDVQNPGKGSVFFHGEKLKPGQTEDFSFTISDFNAQVSAVGFFQWEAAVLSPAQSKFALAVSPSIKLTSTDGKSCPQTTKNTTLFLDYVSTATFTVPEAGNGDVHVKFSLTVPSDYAGSYAAFDKAFVIYPRFNRLGSRSEACFNFPKVLSKQTFIIEDATDDTEVWNVTDPTNIFRYEVSYDDATASATGSFSNVSVKNSSRIFAFRTSATHRSPRVVGTVQHQNIHGLRTPDMLIVCNKSCRKAADELASIHRAAQGLDVQVVCQDEVFNEFSSGTRHPNAIRRLAKMFYDRDNSKLRYLTLFGHTTWDPRALVCEPDDYLISFQCELKEQAREHTTNYCSDFYFGMLADTYSPTAIYRMPTQISIGRIPASDDAEAAAAVSKIKAYFDNPGSVHAYLRALFLSCEGDNNSHLLQSHNAASSVRATSDAFTTIHADNLLYRKDIDTKFHQVEKISEQALNSGIGYFTYSGHGNFVALDGTYIWQFHHVNKYRYSSWPFAMLATCSAWPLDQERTSITEKMLFQPDGGMIGVMAACRSVYLEHNGTFNQAMAKAYSQATDGTCYGDLPRIARNTLISQNSMLLSLGNNTMCFNYCGDPAMPINAPTHRVVIDKINGAEAAGTGSISSKAMSYANVEAHIVDVYGSVMTGFNGSATIEVFDTPITQRFISGKDTFNVSRDHELIAEINAPVVNGQIDAKVLIANPSALGSYNRISIMATEQNGATAAGGSRALKVGYASETADDVDTSAPVIEEIYLNSIEFASGDIVAPEAVLYATVDPSCSGLEYRQNGINNTSSITLDGNIRLTNAIQHLHFDADGKMRIEVPLSALGYGRHSLTFKAVNRLGKSDIRTIDFCVQPDYAKAALIIDGDSEGPARTDVTLAIDSYESDIAVDRLLILDSEGNTVISRNNVSMPFCWNLTDANGNRVPDGVYRAHALFSTENTKGSTQPAEIVVLK
ncbi:MAG: type IX secretion system sortase PorU [Muribaculaceae bacterium]|nr:type IX secretion system sortase PorU [Muribaculaceae bacterium]